MEAGYAAALLFLTAAAICEIRTKSLPVILLTAGAIMTAAYELSIIAEGDWVLYHFMLALLPGILMLILSFATCGSMGAGDGIAALIAGPMLGAEESCAVIVVAFFLSAAVAGSLLAVRRADRCTRIPFMPIMAAAAGMVAICT